MAEKDYTFTKGKFPSELAPNAVKNSEKYGLAFAQAIYSSTADGATSYYIMRNDQFAKNRALSSGKQEFKPILQLLGIDGQNSYVNLSYNPRGIAMKYKTTVLNKLMERKERPKVTALSMAVKTRKERKKTDALARMNEKEFLEEFQGGTGVQLEDPDAFVPKSVEENDIYNELNESEVEELLMQEALAFIFTNNKFDPVQKRTLLSDIWDCGLAVSRDYLDRNGRIITEVVKPEDFVSAPTKTTDFSDCRWCGHFALTQISRLREELKSIGKTNIEEKLYDLAFSNQSLNGNTGGFLGSFNSDWNDSLDRPYDDYYVRVLHFTVKLPKEIIYSKGTDKYGKATFDRKQEAGKKENKNKETFIEKRTTIYRGSYVINSDLMLAWEEDRNILVDQVKETLELPYTARLISNDDGKMMPISMSQLMRSPIESMDLDLTKIQQIIANISPNGFRLDIEVLEGLNLGKGMENISIMELKQIAKQTGDVYYSSKNIAGDAANRNPIEQNIYEIGNTLSSLMSHYAFELQNLKDLIGTNDAADGTSLDPRQGASVTNTQIAVSNTATAHIYNTFVEVKTEQAKHIGIRLWDELKFSKNPNRGYLQLLGKKNSDFIKYRKELTESNYDLQIELDMSDMDKQQLEKDIEIGMGSGLLLEDAIYIRHNFTDYKKASKYLAYQRKVREEMARDIASKNTKEQGAIQESVAEKATLGKQEELKLETQMKQMELSMKGQTELTVKEMDIVRVAMEKLMDNPELQLPQFVQMLIAKYETLEAQRIQAEQEAEMAAQEQAMMEQEQQQVA